MEIELAQYAPVLFYAFAQIALFVIRNKKMANWLRDFIDQKPENEQVSAAPYINGNGTAARAQQTSIELIVDKLNNIESLFKSEIGRVERDTDAKLGKHRSDMERYVQLMGESANNRSQELFTELRTSIENLTDQIRRMNEAA